jgi:hypothetical protein
MKRFDAWGLTVLLLALVFVSGCKKKPSTAQAASSPASTPENTRPVIGNYVPAAGRMVPENDLRQSAGKPPRSLADMPDLRRDMSKAYTAFEKGLYVVNWGADPNHAPDGASRTVLAYEKAAPEMGGVVVFLDGSIRNVTVQEFQTFAKPGAK